LELNSQTRLPWEKKENLFFIKFTGDYTAYFRNSLTGFSGNYFNLKKKSFFQTINESVGKKRVLKFLNNQLSPMVE